MSFAVCAASGAGVLTSGSIVNNRAAGVFSTTVKSNNAPATAGTSAASRVILGGRRSSRGARRGVVKASADAEASQEAYNKAMAEYSKTPFEYRHDLGLCENPLKLTPKPKPPCLPSLANV